MELIIYAILPIIKIVNDQLLSAKDEILLLFSTTNSFYRAKHSGVLDLLRRVPYDVTVKLLIQAANHPQKYAIQQELKESRGRLQVQYITKILQKKIVTVLW